MFNTVEVGDDRGSLSMLSTVRDTLNLVRNPRSKLAQIILKKKTQITCSTINCLTLFRPMELSIKFSQGGPLYLLRVHRL